MPKRRIVSRVPLEVSQRVVTKLRKVCLALPEAREEQAWVGTRWRVGKKTFAHVLTISGGWPPAYAKAVGTDGPVCVLTFRSALPGVDERAFRQRPYFKPVWWPDIAGVVLDARTDWREISTLIVASYCVLAPKKLSAAVRATARSMVDTKE
jgi:predicted DNA-binding protein (MmcQ/YjbR family)